MFRFFVILLFDVAFGATINLVEKILPSVVEANVNSDNGEFGWPCAMNDEYIVLGAPFQITMVFGLLDVFMFTNTIIAQIH